MPDDEEGTAESRYEGLGIAAGIGAAGVVCFFVPAYLDAEGWWRSPWLVAGTVLGLIGVAGAFLEVGNLRNDPLARKGWETMGVAILLLGFAGDIHLAYASGVVRGILGIGARLAVVAVALFAIVGASMGVANLVDAFDRRQRDAKASRAKQGLGLVTALLGLAAAALNVWGGVSGA